MEKDILSEKKFLAILNTIDDGLMIFDNEKKLILMNKSAKSFFEVGDEILNQNSFTLSKHPKLKFLFYLLTEEINKVFRKELKLKEDLILEVSSFQIQLEEKEFGRLIILHDITREKTIDRLKTEFVSVSAHQLRTPLASLRWSLETLSQGRLGQLNLKQKEILQKAKDSIERMLKLINELLDVVKIEEGKYISKISSFSFEEVLKDVIKDYQSKIKEKELKFELKLPSKKLPKLKGDKAKISLVLQNLLENAVRYTFPGGEITVSLNLKGNELEFSIRDTGIGIPKEVQKHIFTKFFRSPNAIKMEAKGSGLGLFVSKNIVKAHGGKIWFESEEGKGTTFYFTLPIKWKPPKK
jgi:signal transduction histidine kinase